MWYNPNLTLSHGCLLNYVLGNRGGGKTYGSFVKGIKNKIYKNKQFIYLRRYKSELEDFATQFDEVSREFPDYIISVKGRTGYIIKRTGDENEDSKNLYKKKNIFCKAVALSNAVTKKSTNYDKVNLIIFDEFIIEKSSKLFYLPNEVDALIGFMETVFRSREKCQCLCLANSVTMNNPHCVYWGYTKRIDNKDIVKDKDGLLLFHHFADQEYINFKSQTKLGMLQRKSKIGGYLIDNEFINDDSPFIKNKTPEAIHIASVDIYGKHLGLWMDYKDSKLYISTKVGKNDSITYALTTDDMQPNVVMLQFFKNNHHMRLLRTMFQNACVYYDDTEAYFSAKDLNKLL